MNTPIRDDSTHVIFETLDFMARLAALAIVVWTGVSFYLDMRATLSGIGPKGEVRIRIIEANFRLQEILVAGGVTNQVIRDDVQFRILGFATFAEMDKADVSVMPTNCGSMPDIGDEARFEKALSLVQGAKMQRSALRYADAWQAFLVKVDLRTANLQWASLDAANLQGADLRETTDLTCKQLVEATYWGYSYRDEELAWGAEIPPKKKKDEKTGKWSYIDQHLRMPL